MNGAQRRQRASTLLIVAAALWWHRWLPALLLAGVLSWAVLPQTARRESRQSSGPSVAASMATKNHCADSAALERHACVLGCERTHQAESLADRAQRSGAVDHPVRQLVDVVRSRGRSPIAPGSGRSVEAGLVRPQGLQRPRMTSFDFTCRPRKSGSNGGQPGSHGGRPSPPGIFRCMPGSFERHTVTGRGTECRKSSKFVQIAATQRADGSPVLYALDEGWTRLVAEPGRAGVAAGLRCATGERRRAVPVSTEEANLSSCPADAE